MRFATIFNGVRVLLLGLLFLHTLSAHAQWADQIGDNIPETENSEPGNETLLSNSKEIIVPVKPVMDVTGSLLSGDPLQASTWTNGVGTFDNFGFEGSKITNAFGDTGLMYSNFTRPLGTDDVLELSFTFGSVNSKMGFIDLIFSVTTISDGSRILDDGGVRIRTGHIVEPGSSEFLPHYGVFDFIGNTETDLTDTQSTQGEVKFIYHYNTGAWELSVPDFNSPEERVVETGTFTSGLALQAISLWAGSGAVFEISDFSVTAGLENESPEITNLRTENALEVGGNITVLYDYTDAESDAESGSTYKWFTDDVEVAGATSSSYSPSINDLGKTLKVEVTPSDGNSFGTAVSQVLGMVSCAAGFTCETQDVSVCDSDTYQVPNGPLVTENGSYEGTSGTVKTYYNVTFDRVEQTSDVFANAVVTESGTVAYQANTNVTGVLQFDKAEDRWVDLNALQDDLNGTSRSIFMWIKSENNVASTEQILFGINPATSGSTITNFFIDDNDDNLETNDGGNNHSASFNVGGEVWHYVGYTYNATTHETVIYVNGIENARYTNNQLTTGTSRYSLGQEFDGATQESNHYNGKMAEVSVWNEVLTGADIREAMSAKINNGHAKYANLVGYYSVFGNCDDDTSVLTDHSGKGNHGVMKAFTVDFKNVDNIPGFNAVDWYENLSWKKNGVQVATEATYTTNEPVGEFELIATRNFIKSSDIWTASPASVEEIDTIADETVCSTDARDFSTTDLDKVSFLDFEKDNDDWVDASTAMPALIGKSRSIFMWVNKESAVPSGTSYQILTIHADNGDEAVTRFYINSGEKLGITANGTDYVSNANINLGEWMHVGYTYDASSNETILYVNGEVVLTRTISMPLEAGAIATMGMRYEANGPSRFFDGKMVDVTLWDKVLSPEEIAALKGASPANDVADLVAKYGTQTTIAQSLVHDATGNGYTALASNPSILVTTEEATIANYDASANYSFSWTKEGTEFSTNTTPNSGTIDEGTTNYSVTYGSPFFQKTDDFALSYTNLLPTQPISQTAGVTGSVTFEVDEIPGATYQWFKRSSGFNETSNGENGLSFNGVVNDIFEMNGVIYATVSGSEVLFISRDNGESWTSFDLLSPDPSIPPNLANANGVSISGDANRIFVNTQSALFVTEDDGLNFSLITTYNDLFNSTTTFGFFYTHLDGETLYVTSNDGLAVTSDAGQNWDIITNATIGSSGLFNVYAEDNSIYLASGTEGLFVSNDSGVNWERISVSDGLTSDNLQVVTIQDGRIYVGTDEGLSFSDDDGQSWTSPNHFSGIKILDIVKSNGTIYVGTQSRDLNTSIDNGVTWTRENLNIQNNGSGAVSAIHAVGDQLYFGAITGVKVSNNKSPLVDNSDQTATNQIQGATTHKLTVNNLSLEENTTEYFVEVTLGDCTEASDDITLTVLDVPVVSSTTPANGASDIAIDTQLSMEFSKSVTAGTGNLKIFNYATDAEVQSFSASQLTFDGTTVTLSTGVSLDYATQYYITLEADLVKDGSDAGNLAYNNKDFWSFTTVCEPLVLSQPENQVGAVGGSVTFSVPEVAGASYQWFRNSGNGEYTTITSGQNGFAASSAINAVYAEGNKVYAGTDGGLSISTDGGANWTTTTSGTSGFASSNTVSSVFAEGNTIYAATTAGLSISNDGGANWTTTAIGQNGFAQSGVVRTVYAQGNTVYAGTFGDNFILRDAVLSISTDGGLNWSTIGNGENGFSVNDDVLSIYAQGNTIYVGTDRGLSISTDGGANWSNTSSGENGFAVATNVNSLYADGSKVYAGTEGGGLSVSIDGGINWTTIIVGQNGFAGSGFVNSVYANGDKVYAATEEGLSVSTDAGATWTTTTQGQNGFANSNSVNSVYGQGDKIYVATEEGLSIVEGNELLSNEPDNAEENQVQGATTRELTINNLTTDLDQSEYFVVVTKGECEETSETATLTIVEEPVIVSTTPANGTSDIAVDSNLAITFTEPVTKGSGNILIKNIADDAVFATIDVTSASVSISDKTLTIDPSMDFDFAETYYVELEAGVVTGNTTGQPNLEVTGNDHFSFTTVCPVLITAQPEDQTGFVSGSVTFSVPEVAGASYQWFEKLENPAYQTTEKGQNGFASSDQVKTVFVEGDRIYAGTRRGLSISTDGGFNWTNITNAQNGFPGENIISLYAEGNNVYVGTDAGLAISTDGGLTWTATVANQNGFSSVNFINSVYAQGNRVFVGTSVRGNPALSVSTDGGNNWSTILRGENGFQGGSSLSGEGDTIYALASTKLSISTDGGTNWTAINAGENGLTTQLRRVFVQGNKVYVASFNGLSISTDGGANWTTITAGQNGFAGTNNITSVYADGDNIYVGTFSSGLSISDDGGQSWTTIRSGQNDFPSDMVNSVYAINGTVYVGTSDAGFTHLSGNALLAGQQTGTATNQLLGATTRELTINNLTTDFDQKQFVVVVTKGDCEETSDIATLTVQDGVETTTFTHTNLSPADDAIEVDTDQLPIPGYLSINFSDPVSAGTAGKISVYKADDNSLFKEYDFATEDIASFTVVNGQPLSDFELKNINIVELVEVADLNNTSQSGAIYISATDLALDPETEYYILIDEGVVVGKSNVNTIYEGITDNTVWSFTTKALPPVLVSALLPADEATALNPDVLNAGSLTSHAFDITFDQAIEYSNTDAKFNLYTASDNQLVASQTLASTISGPNSGDITTVEFSFFSYTFLPSTEYYILIDAGMVKSKATGVEFAGITDNTVWNFTTAAEPFDWFAIAPSVGFQQTGVDVPLKLSDFQFAYYQSHFLGLQTQETGFSIGDPGKIGLYTSADDQLVYQIDLAQDPIILNPQAGETGKVFLMENALGALILTIQDEFVMNPETQYYWLVDEGIVINPQGGRSAAIDDKTIWTFTTEAATVEPLELQFFYPAPDEPLDLSTDRVFLYFSNEIEIAAGTGNLTIFKGSDDTVFETLNIADFTIRNSGSTYSAVADITNTFELGETYYVQYPEGFIKSTDGTKSIAAVTDKTSWTFGSTVGGPIFDEFFPAPGSSNYDVSRGQDFQITTTEDITAGELEPIGAIRIYNASDDSLVKTIAYEGENENDVEYPDEGDELEIGISRNELEPDTEYYVLIDDGFMVSYDGPSYRQGISDPNTWRFRTAALPTEPTLVSTLPANVAANVAVEGNLQLTFSENVKAGSGNIVIHRADNSVFETIAASTTSISGATVTLDPINNLDYSTTYYVLIDTEAFESNNNIGFAGITESTTWLFTTEALPNTAPVASTQDFTGTLEVNQQLEGNYTYTDADTDTESGTTYQWYVADDAAGTNSTAISGATAQNFTLTENQEGKFIAFAITPNDGEDAGTEVFTAYKGAVVAAVIPTLVSTVPGDGAEDVIASENLSFVLSEAVTVGFGNITLTPTSGTATIIDVSSSEVSISGTNITIDPFSDLLEGQFYTVTFDASAFIDSDGNSSAGLSSQTVWNFTTKEAQVAPVASAVNINRSIIVDGTLEGTYSYSDANDDPESGSTYQWYRADDASGTNRVAIAGATSEDYVAVTADNNKYVSFEVTPNDGNQAGNAEESDFFGPVLINDGNTNIPPAFTSEALITVLDNVAYSYTITFEDLNNDTPVLTKTTGPDWLTVSGFNLTGTPGAANIGEHAIVLTLDDQNGGVVTQEFTITVEASNVAPSVNAVEITGTTTIDQQLNGTYNFLDDDGDADNSAYQWYRADDATGTNKTAISGATATTYTLTTDDAAKFISFEVTPNDGTVDGTAGESTVVGAVAKKEPSLSLANISKVYGDASFDLSANTNSSGVITYSFDNDQTGAAIAGSTVTLGNVGTITVDISLAEDAEFEARTISNIITVAQRVVEFTATDASKAIGEDDPELMFTVTSGAIVGDDAVVSISRAAGESAGTYTIGFTEGADAANYDISTVDGTFTIGQVELTITADAATKTYGDADQEFTYTITSGTLANGDKLEGTITRESGEDVGTYALESLLFNPKYDITFITANLTITKADLSISVDDQSRNFGETNPTLTLSFDGLKNGDTGADFDTPPVASTTATETSAAGTYDITLNTPADGNYNIIGTTNGTLTVNNVDIALTIADVSADEDDGDIIVTVVLDNAVSGGFTVDVSTIDGTATAGTDYTVVSGETLTFTGTAGEQQSFTIIPSADFDEESDETLTVILGNLAGTTLPVDITDNATITINNDDVASDLFIITFETTADNESVNLPTSGMGYNYGIDWGDGTIDFGVTGDKEHTYATAGIYTVKITGDFPRIFFKGADDAASDANALKIKSIEQWGTNQWSSMNGAFEGAMSMVINATDVPDLTAVFNMEEMFSDCDALTNDDFSAWDVSSVTNMKEMFERTDNFNGNISNWDVSNVTNMQQMFKDAVAFNGDISSWNTGNVLDMSQMFEKSEQSDAATPMSFNQNINGWNVSAVINFGSMFEENTVFNQGLNNWDVSSAEGMEDMFKGASLFNGDISDWDVSSVTDMDEMFQDAVAFNQDISGWDVGAVVNMEEMFDGAAAFNANIRNWDVAAVTSMKDMFEDASAFNADISIWQTTALTNMDGMFLRASAFNQDISNWDISNLTSLERVFENASAFDQDLSGWNTGNITSMSSLFEEASAFNQDISNWNVSTVTDMSDMFLNATAFDQSLGNWNVGTVGTMENMLSGSGLSVANYDATLTAWAAQIVQSGVALGAVGLEYCASLADRQSLIDNDSWTINGDSQACETVVTITDIGGVEDDGDIAVTLTSSNKIIGGFTVDVSTVDGTATAGSDYTAITSQTLTFNGDAGEEQTFIISPSADSDDEPNETILVNMGNLQVAAGNTVDITDQGTVTIFNEDVASAFFTTVWETTNDNESITIPTEGEGYNYRVDWGDGTIEKNQTGTATHTYATSGTHTVKIVGSFPRIIVSNVRGNESKLKSVEQWGTIEWLSMESAFAFVTDLEINAPGSPDLSQVTSMVRMFQSASNMNSDISGWDVSNVEDMRNMFQSATAFNQDISQWDVSKVTNMAAMFSSAKAFNQPLDNWNVSNVTSMQLMFINADAFNQDLNSWDVSKVESFDGMFKQTDVFNGNITSWNVSSGTNFEEMFQEADAFNQPIGNWNLASATKVRRMFQETEVFNQSLNNWRFPNLTNTEQMFRKTKAFNQDLNDWEMGNITAINDMFEEAEAFNGSISNWDVSNVKDFSFAFDEAENFNQDISGWDVGKGENFRNMFDEATNFNQDLSAWEVGNGTRFFAMFNKASSFDQDISAWDMTSATDLGSMLSNSGLSIANYDALLTAWAKQDVQSDLEFGVEGLQYCGGSNGRQALIDVKRWTIESDGINCISTVTIEDVMVAEDGGDITVTLSSDGFVAEGFTVDVSTADGTATAGTDYNAVSSQTVTFFGAAGETQAFTITPIADSDVEVDENLTVSMSNVVTGANNTITITDQATVTIENDDEPVVSFASISASNSESVTSSAIEVVLDQAGLSTATVNYTITGTATSDADYTLANGTLTFVAGDVSENISLAIIDDAILEGNETVILTLSNPSGATLGTTTVHTYTITDNDVAAVTIADVSGTENGGAITLTATLDNAVQGGFTVDVSTLDGTATIADGDYTAIANQTLTFAGTAGETQTFTILPTADTKVEADETVTVSMSNLDETNLAVTITDNATITINNDDVATVAFATTASNGLESVSSAIIPVTLSSASVSAITVDYTIAGTATASTDYTLANGTLTFVAGETSKGITVASIVDDAILEGNETVIVTLSNPSGATLGTSTVHTYTITDNDAAAITIADISGNEGDGAITVTATLDNAVQGGFTVDVSTTDGTATVANNDYTAVTSHTLTFAGTAGETQTFTVTPTNDLIIENDESLMVRLSNLSTSLNVDITDGATVTITNDDFNNFPTDIALSATSIAENNALDATIGSLTTTDADAGDSHTYSLVSGTGDTGNASFIIAGNELKVNNTSFNFEDRTSYSIRVQTDDGSGGIYAKALTIEVTNVNESPFALSLTNSTIDESDDAQEVGGLMTLDPDNGDTFSYALIAGEGDTHNGQFTISGNTLSTAGAIDFEDGASRSIRVEVTDAGGLTFVQTFTITIEDVVAEPVREFTTNVPGGNVKNVFSPNGDGVNETWVIEDLLDNPFNQVKVFAQGGKVIYSKVNYTNDWGGTFKNNPVPDGTYYYEIVIFANAQSTTPARTIKGFLTIIRNR